MPEFTQQGAENTGAPAPAGVSPTPGIRLSEPGQTTPQPAAATTTTPQPAAATTTTPQPAAATTTAPQPTAAAQTPELGTPGDKSQETGETLTPENGGEGQSADAEGDRREKFIPRERFDEIHTRAQAAEEEREATKRELAEVREAASLGFRDVAQYKAVSDEAKQFGFPDAGSYLSALQQQQATTQEIAQINDRADLADDVKADLVAAKQINLQAQQQLLQSRALTQQMQKQALETTLSDAKRDLGLAELPAGMERIFRQSSPDVVRAMVAEIKPLIKQQTQAEVARYAAAKDGDRQTVTPEGRGGTSPAPAAGKANWRSASFASLLHGGRKG